MRANLDEAPKSPFTMDDIVNHTINSVQKKWIKKEDIREEVEYINGNQFTKQKINKIVLQIKNRLEVAKVGIPLCNTYDDKSAQVWLKDIAKIQSNQNNNGIHYITYASSMTGKFVTWLARKYQELLQDIQLNNKTKCKELRVVIQTGDLASSDLERSWKDALDYFRIAFKENLQDVQVLVNDTANNYFNVVELPTTLSQGRHAFKIFGSEFLKRNVPLKMEILDSFGNTVYISPVDFVGEETPPYLPYRFVTMEVYKPPVNREGIAELTILGEIDPSAVDFQIPSQFQNSNNV